MRKQLFVVDVENQFGQRIDSVAVVSSSLLTAVSTAVRVSKKDYSDKSLVAGQVLKVREVDIIALREPKSKKEGKRKNAKHSKKRGRKLVRKQAD